MSSRISQRIRSRRNQCRKLLVEAGRVAAAAGPAALLVGPLGNGVGDAAPPQPGAYRAGAVALVAQHLSGSRPGPSRPEAGHPDRLHHGGELRAVVRAAARQHEAERAPQGIAGQAAPGTSECGDAEPPFRAPPACWWARTAVESTDTSQSISPAASARAARSIRSKVPSRAHRRKRVCSVCQEPCRSGTSRQAVPVRNFHTIPLSTVRSSSRFRPRTDWGNNGRRNSHSASDSYGDVSPDRDPLLKPN